MCTQSLLGWLSPAVGHLSGPNVFSLLKPQKVLFQLWCGKVLLKSEIMPLLMYMSLLPYVFIVEFFAGIEKLGCI